MNLTNTTDRNGTTTGFVTTTGHVLHTPGCDFPKVGMLVRTFHGDEGTTGHEVTAANKQALTVELTTLGTRTVTTVKLAPLS